MIRRSTWVVLALFLFLTAATIIWQKSPLKKTVSTATPYPTSLPPILQSIDGISITEIDSKNNQGLSISLIRKQNSQWEFSPNPTSPVDQGRVEELITTLKSLKPLSLIDPTTPLSPLGLDNPNNIIEIRTTTGISKIIAVGKLTVTDSGYYILLDNKDIAVLNKISIEEFLKLLTIENLSGWENEKPSP